MRKQWPILLILCLGGFVIWMSNRPQPEPMPTAESASATIDFDQSPKVAPPLLPGSHPIQAGVAPSQADVQAPWPEDEWQHEFSEEGFRLFNTQADPALLHSLTVGDQVRLFLPEGHGSVVATITEQRDGLPGTRVSSGMIEGMGDTQGVDVVQGQLDTHITLITEEATWTMVVDNQTGRTIVVDERERVQRQVLSDEDGIELPEPELPSPPDASP